MEIRKYAKADEPSLFDLLMDEGDDWRDYLYGERGYIILSLVAKSVLAWLAFAGAMQPV